MKHVVLVVDDDLSLRSGLVQLVEMQGKEAITAATIKEGLEKLALGPSHLLLDLNLPDGEGTTILRHVRAHKLPIKVAVLSGSSNASLLAETHDLRPDAVFPKPPDWNALLGWMA